MAAQAAIHAVRNERGLAFRCLIATTLAVHPELPEVAGCET